MLAGGNLRLLRLLCATANVVLLACLQYCGDCRLESFQVKTDVSMKTSGVAACSVGLGDQLETSFLTTSSDLQLQAS